LAGQIIHIARRNQVRAGSYFRRARGRRCDSQGVVALEVDHGDTKSASCTSPGRGSDAHREHEPGHLARVELSHL